MIAKASAITAEAVASRGVRACPIATLASENADSPAVTIPVEQIAFWQELWRQAVAKDRSKILRGWHRTCTSLRKLPDSLSRWRSVSSPIAATITTLTDQGWLPHYPSA